DYAAAMYASSNQAYLSSAKNAVGHHHGSSGGQAAPNNGLFGSNPAIGGLNLPAPPPAHHHQSSSGGGHVSFGPGGSLVVNPNTSHASYSYGLSQAAAAANPLPAHIQQPSAHSQLPFPQANYAPGAGYVGAIQPLNGAAAA